MSLKINNSLNISSQNLNQSSTFNNASCTIEDASKNLALAQRLTTDKNPAVQSQIVIAELMNTSSYFIKDISNIFNSNNNRLMDIRPTMIPTASTTNNTTPSCISNTMF
ncbi:MAG: hypothetical protein WAQ98_12985 [Blastocatellia bacterium]